MRTKRWLTICLLLTSLTLLTVTCNAIPGGDVGDESGRTVPADSSGDRANSTRIAGKENVVTNAELQRVSNDPDRYVRAAIDVTGKVTGTQRRAGDHTVLLVDADPGSQAGDVQAELPEGQDAPQVGSTVRVTGTISRFEPRTWLDGTETNVSYVAADAVEVQRLPDGSTPMPTATATPPVTPTEMPTDTPLATDTPVPPTTTSTPLPTDTPVPVTSTPMPSSTVAPPQTSTATLPPTPVSTPESSPTAGTTPLAALVTPVPTQTAAIVPTQAAAATRTPVPAMVGTGTATAGTTTPAPAPSDGTPLSAVTTPAPVQTVPAPTATTAPTQTAQPRSTGTAVPVMTPAATAPATQTAGAAPGAPRFEVALQDNSDQSVRIETEAMARDPKFSEGQDPGSSGQGFVETTASNQGWDGRGKPPQTGQASATIVVPEAGRYAVWVRMRYQHKDANSVWLQVDDDRAIRVGNEENGYEAWKWVGWQDGQTDRRIILELTPGEHQITLVGREKGSAIDAVIVTNDLEAIPED